MSPSAGLLPRIENVQLQDGNLTWTYVKDQQRGHATIDEVLFTLQPAQKILQKTSGPSFSSTIICCLKEDSAKSPFFSLHLLTTVGASIPDALLTHAPRLSPAGLPDHLQSTPTNKVDVILSTKSGTGRGQSFWTHVLRPLLELLLLLSQDYNDAVSASETGQQKEPWDVLLTQDEQTVRLYAKELHHQDSSRRTIILISGDGGIVDLLNGREANTQASTPHLLALLPLGTANALFHSLHKGLEADPGPTPLVLALRTLFLGTPRDLPMFKTRFTPGSRIVSYTSATADNDKIDLGDKAVAPLARTDTAISHLFGAIVASYALHASIVHESDTPEYRIHGRARFSMVAEKLLQESHPYQATLEVQSAYAASPAIYRHITPDTHSYILLSMVSNLERNFTISPATKPLDGTLHLVHIGAVDSQKIMQAMTGAYQGGTHTLLEWENGERVLYEQVDRLRITTQEEDARWRKFCVDGTIVEVGRGGGMEVERVEDVVFRVLVDRRMG
ncbi:hypothetical protein E4U17_003892 [Claviceps sp. LM77 group G4]|nr:hypothetical protein E4U17_003892 [Claviceps sp. LM77 group G4]KAG6061965.1 hypothetical protein E4U33_006618 [Claviceps sp. LM78 group G4]KAG6079623.1 hypothetical protein E4U16_000942 [Claviceps sp. LM84 group G4]